MAQLNWGAVTNEGQIRTQNEDSLLVRDGVFVVADGMGGHQAGEVASALAVSRMQNSLGGEPAALDRLIQSINDANSDIYEAASGDETQQGMGTTVTALAVITGPSGEEALGLANVGDSRTYVFRNGRLRRITVDHNYVQELIDAGHITPDEARMHPRRNIITRALGIEPIVRVDAWTMPLVRGDRFLLCSDGLVDEVTDEDIADVLATHSDPQRAAEVLVDMANDSGGRDNVTVIVVDVLDGAEPEAADDELELEPVWAAAPVTEDETTEEYAVAADPDGSAADAADQAAVAAGVLAPDADRPSSPETHEPTGDGTRTDAIHTDGAPVITDDDATAAPAPRLPRRRGRGRLGRFVAAVLVLAILVSGFVVFAAWARRGYYLAFDESGVVTLYKGREDGVLWFEPTVEGPTSLTRDDLDEESITRIDGTPNFSSRASAEEYLGNVISPTTTTTTTTTSTTTTTTQPPTTTRRATTTTIRQRSTTPPRTTPG